MHKRKLLRSALLNANILELQALAKLYSLPCMGNEKYKINWIDGLQEYLEEAMVINWGCNAIAPSLQLGGFSSKLGQLVDDIGVPSMVQSAIIARLVGVKGDRSMALQELDLKPNELFLVERLWKVYEARNLILQAIELLINI